MTGLLIFTCGCSTLLLLGMIGGKDPEDKKNYTYGFCTTMLALTMIIGIIYK